MRLDDWDFANDLAFLSQTHQQIQITTNSVAAASASVSFNIHRRKGKILKYNTENPDLITLDGETLEDVESFTYLDSIVDKQGKYDADVKTRNGKESIPSIQSNKIWNSIRLSANQHQSHNLQYERQHSSTVWS
ncbi:unnamed protein product [Schistosoma mattheei]|uniref:Uncharacterized protein n=1 Tax=Schistosoma mattheei TaxID=31246 RepID=A0A183NLM3_9TREM|nr:unnamed protein product [Schistosoma mattheei]